MNKYLILIIILISMILGSCYVVNHIDRRPEAPVEKLYSGAVYIYRININGTWYIFNTAGGIIPEVKE
jgi:hypothetical protein